MSWISYRQFLFRSAGRSQRALSEHNQGAPVGRVETLIEAHENAFLTFGSGRRRNLDRESRVRTGLFPGGRWIRTIGPPSEGPLFRDSSFPTCAPPPLRKRSPPRPAVASPSCRSRSDERRTHSPTWRSSRSPDRRHHPFALITALCFFFISCSCAVALSRGQGSTLSQTVSF